MASRKSKKFATRRDRRKAKMSGWKRAGKKNNTKKGHGTSGGQININLGYKIKKKSKKKLPKDGTKIHLTFKLWEVLK